MIKERMLYICIVLLFSCSSDNGFKTKIEKEFYDGGQLKTLLYLFKKDDIKKIGFLSNGSLDYIQNISNNGKDNFMVIFDDVGKLWLIGSNKNHKRNGKFIAFDEGNIVTEDEYLDDKLVE